MHLFKQSGWIPSSWNRVLRGFIFLRDLKLELILFYETHENRMLCEGTLQERERRAFRKTRKQSD